MMYWNLWVKAKAVLRRKFIVMSAYIKMTDLNSVT
jgi:hypothetical protein